METTKNSDAARLACPTEGKMAAAAKHVHVAYPQEHACRIDMSDIRASIPHLTQRTTALTKSTNTRYCQKWSEPTCPRNPIIP